jgi:hypothetical protein
VTPLKTVSVQGLGGKNDFAFEPKTTDEIKAAMANPDISPEDVQNLINQRLTEAGQAPLGVAGGPNAIAEYRKNLAKAKAQPGDISYTNVVDQLPIDKTPTATPTTPIDTLLSSIFTHGADPDAFGSLKRGYQEAVQYGTPGFIAREYASLSGQGTAELKKAFPNLNDDQIEQLRQSIIAKTQEGVRASNAEATANDPTIPHMMGMLPGSAGPEDAIPGGEVAGFAKRTGRAIAQNAATDVAYQGLDIHQGVQDSYNPEQTLAAGALGGALHLGVEGTHAALATTKDRTPIVSEAQQAANRYDDRTNQYIQQSGKKPTWAVRQEAAANAAADHINDVTNGWVNPPEFEVHNNFSKLPIADKDAIGMIDDSGKVVVNMKAVNEEAKAQNVHPTDVLTAVTYHEALGHHGMTQAFGDGLDDILTHMYDNGPTFQRKVDTWLKDNPDAYKDSPNRVARGADEVLAEMSEKGQMPVSITDRFKNYIKDTARKMGINWDYSTREINSILGMAHNGVIDGKIPTSENSFVGSRYMSPNREQAFMEYANAQNVRPSQLFDDLENGKNPEAEETIKAREAQLAGRAQPKPVDETDRLGMYDTEKTDALTRKAYDEPGKVHTDRVWPRDQSIVDFKYGDPETKSIISGAFRKNGKTAEDLEIYGDGRNTIGPKSLQSIRRQIKDQFPELDKIEATRISGARKGGKTVDYRAGDPVSVRFMKRGNTGDRYMVTYHGSPHDFDEFDHEHMGKGEGAQVYGWGTYLTDTKDIAEGYRDRLSHGGVLTLHTPEGSKSFASYDTKKAAFHLGLHDTGAEGRGSSYPAQHMLMRLVQNGESVEEAAAHTRENYPHFDQKLVEKGIATVKAANPKITKGKLYEVDIPDDAKWLHWDHQQNDDIKELLGKAGLLDTSSPEVRVKAKANLDKTNARINVVRGMLNKLSRKHNLSFADELHDPVGSKLHAELDDLERDREDYLHQLLSGTGKEIYQGLVKKLGSDEAASKALDKAGITGTKYYDGFSRRAGEGSHNYVIYNDKTPKITAKYMKRKSKDISNDDIFESENALKNLHAITDDYTPVTISMDELRREAEARGLSPDRLLNNKAIDLGELPRRFIMQDIAAEKLNSRVTALNNKIQNGGGSYKDRDAHLTSLLKFKELSARIFDEQGEAGRLLRTIQELTYTKKKVNATREALEGLSVEDLQNLLDNPEEYMRFAKGIQDQLAQAKDSLKNGKAKEGLASVLNIPRALMSSVDLSAPFRQGLFLVGRPEFWKGIPDMLKYFGSKGAFENLMTDITKRSTYPKMVHSGLSFSGNEGRLSSHEEAFQSNLAEKVPLVAASERAYVGFLNKLRADTFDSLLSEAKNLGVDTDKDKFNKDLAKFINHATGRGDLGGALNSAAPLLNSLFFSPRLIASRVQLLNPAFYVRLDPFVRQQAIKSLLSTAGFVSTVLSLSALAGAKVQTDPRSTDFGKAQVGDTRYDLLGGFAQYITLGARLLAGEEKSATGEIKPYGNKFGQKTRLDTSLTFAMNKTAPVPSFIIDALRGTDTAGQPFNLKTAAASRFIPMFIQDFMDVSKEYGYGQGSVRAVPGIVGVGIQNYTPTAIDPNKEVEAPDSFTMQEAADGENSLVSVKDGTVSLKGKAQDEWKRRVNFYSKEWMKDEMADPKWKKMTLQEKADAIKSVHNDAKKQTKEDMIPLLGLDGGSTN